LLLTTKCTKVAKDAQRAAGKRLARTVRFGRRKVDSPDATPLIIGAAIAVHRALGPGLLESAYDHCLFFEMSQVRGLKVERQYPLSIVYGGVRIPAVTGWTSS
jgi:hypothetical protein